ncbi:hypothetical protein DB347_14990 [Opitutaceae bacterium EW11]|nr:hypothetical protein DB347_14990 [Opitutaceae bacterium EW11]
MELRQLRYFKGVAELLSFSRAAEQLRVAQSALSRQIQSLEQEVGTRLFTRDRSHVALTDAGKAFYASINKILIQVDIAVTEAQQIARGAVGELLLCTDWRIDAQFVATVVDEFRRKNSRVEIAVRDAAVKDQISMLRSGEAHVGFIAREFIGNESDLEFLSIKRVYINAILPTGHPFAKAKQVRLSDLAKEHWIDLGEKEAGGFRGYFIQQCRLSGFNPRLVRTEHTLDGLFGHVASGYGISAAPDHVRPRPGVPLSLVRTDCPPVDFGAVWRTNDSSPLLQRFVELLRLQIKTVVPDQETETDAATKTT